MKERPWMKPCVECSQHHIHMTTLSILFRLLFQPSPQLFPKFWILRCWIRLTQTCPGYEKFPVGVFRGRRRCTVQLCQRPIRGRVQDMTLHRLVSVGQLEKQPEKHTTIACCHLGIWRWRSVLRFPGLTLVDTILSPCRRANSRATTTSPYKPRPTSQQQDENLHRIHVRVYFCNTSSMCRISSFLAHLRLLQSRSRLYDSSRMMTPSRHALSRVLAKRQWRREVQAIEGS